MAEIYGLVAAPLADNTRKAGAAPRRHVCPLCFKTFTRSEHCIRHQNAHSKERPFGCRLCHKRYNRRDLAIRHERTVHTAAPTETSSFMLDTTNPIEPSTIADSTVQAQNTVTISLGGQELNNEGHSISGSADQSCFSPSRSSPGEMSYLAVDLENIPRRNDGTTQPDTETIPGMVQQMPSSLQQNAATVSIDLNNMEYIRRSGETFSISNPEQECFPDTEFSGPLNPSLAFFVSQNHMDESGIFHGYGHSFTPLEQFSEFNDMSSHQQGLGFQEDRSQFPLRNITQIEANAPVVQRDTYASSNSTGSSLPKVATNTPATFPILTFTEETRSLLLADLQPRLSRLAPNNATGFDLPSAAAIQRYLRTYVDSFEVHFSVLHINSLDLGLTPSPLILAMCAIGALYRFERKAATSFFRISQRMLNEEYSDASDNGQNIDLDTLGEWSRSPADEVPATPRQLWELSASFLLNFYAAFNGESKDIRKAIAGMNYFYTEYQMSLPILRPRASTRQGLKWREWIERESMKRLCYGNLILSNLVTVGYGACPNVSSLQDGDIEMPDDQILWDAPNADQWQKRADALPQNFNIPSLRDTVAQLMYGGHFSSKHDIGWELSPFAVTVVMHATAVRLGLDAQYAQFCSILSKSLVMAQIKIALRRCEEFIASVLNVNDNKQDQSERRRHSCLALLRILYTRIFLNEASTNLKLSLWNQRADFTSTIQEFVTMETTQQRDETVILAVSHAFKAFLIAQEVGQLLVKKTAALTWSIEIAIANWDAVLLVAKWVSTMQLLRRKGTTLNKAEVDTLESICNFLRENGSVDITPQTCLAAELLRLRANFYDDIWVWRATVRIGWLMRELALAFERQGSC